jgi:hypothetical protein
MGREDMDDEGVVGYGAVEVGVEIECDCCDLGRGGRSNGFNLSPEARGVSSFGENGETGLEIGLRLPLLWGNVSALSLSPLGS